MGNKDLKEKIMSKFKEILDNVSADVLTEDSKTAIVEAFETAVKDRVDERVELEVQTALERLDEDHSTKLEQLVEAIDADHLAKLKTVVAKIDEDHISKLTNVVKKYEGMLKEEATGFRDTLVDEISNYLDLYLDKVVPMKQISEACENTQAKKMIDDIKKIVAVDEGYITENIKEALEDGKNSIDTLRQELSEAVKANVQLHQIAKNANAALLLEKKTSAIADNKKEYVLRVLGDKSPDYIEENFDFVVEMFERDEKEDVDLITEAAKTASVTQQVDTPESRIKDENPDIIEENNSSDEPVNEYLNELKRTER